MPEPAMLKSPKSHSAKRRPAMIPADAELTSEDKQAIKLRTGRWPVLVHPAASSAAHRADKNKTQVAEEAVKKRKPSTTAEQYYDKCNDGELRKTFNAKHG